MVPVLQIWPNWIYWRCRTPVRAPVGGPAVPSLAKFFLLTTFRFFSLGPLSSGKFTFGDPTRGDCPLTTELPGTQQFLHCVKVAKCCQEAFLQKMPARWRFNNGCPSNDKHKTAMKGRSKPIGSASHSRKKNKKRKAWGMKNNRTNSWAVKIILAKCDWISINIFMKTYTGL